MDAGLAATAIDVFADEQTIALAEKSIAVQYGRIGFDAEALMTAVDALDASRFMGFVYGSGFEAQPGLLAHLAGRLPLIGNSPEAVAAVKNPDVFFAELQQRHIRYPQVSDSIAIGDGDDYLFKFVGGSGGIHIRNASSKECLAAESHYYQQKISGCAVSLLFLANRNVITVIGFNEQWLNPSVDEPYRYGGAVSHAPLSETVKSQLCDAAHKLTKTFELVGINSLDAIVTDDNRVFVLEINPRLSATIDLYHLSQPDLLRRHVRVCLGENELNLQSADVHNKHSKAHAIVYAAAEIELTTSLIWPEWVVDTPPVSQLPIKILAGDPICTVHAVADDAQAAKKLAQSRVEIVENLLQSMHQ